MQSDAPVGPTDIGETRPVRSSKTFTVGAVLFHDGERVICLDRASGGELWKSDPIPRAKKINSFFAPTLVVQDGVVLFAGGEESGLVKSGGGATKDDTMTALSAETGRV